MEAWKLKGRTRSNRSDQEERRKAGVWRSERRRKQMIDHLIRSKRRMGPGTACCQEEYGKD